MKWLKEWHWERGFLGSVLRSMTEGAVMVRASRKPKNQASWVLVLILGSWGEVAFNSH